MIPLPLTHGILLGHLATKTREAALVKDLQAIHLFPVLGHFYSGLAKYAFYADRLWDLISGRIGQVARFLPLCGGRGVLV
jgi:hypothetical protein